MNRREMLMFSISMASPVFLSSGCVALVGLLRVGARGGLIRAGARAARRGRRGQIATFGRTGATTLQLMRLGQVISKIQNIQKVGEIYGTDDDLNAVDIRANNKLCETYVDGAPISTTRVDGYYWEHSSVLFGSCGYSSADRKDPDQRVIKHWDASNNLVGVDVYENGEIRHIDKDGVLVGKTPLVVTRAGCEAKVRIPDDSYLRTQLQQLTSELEKHERGLADISEILRAQENCAEQSNNQSCSDQAGRANLALKRLEDRYA